MCNYSSAFRKKPIPGLTENSAITIALTGRKRDEKYKTVCLTYKAGKILHKNSKINYIQLQNTAIVFVLII